MVESLHFPKTVFMSSIANPFLSFVYLASKSIREVNPNLMVINARVQSFVLFIDADQTRLASCIEIEPFVMYTLSSLVSFPNI